MHTDAPRVECLDSNSPFSGSIFVGTRGPVWAAKLRPKIPTTAQVTASEHRCSHETDSFSPKGSMYPYSRYLGLKGVTKRYFQAEVPTITIWVHGAFGSSQVADELRGRRARLCPSAQPSDSHDREGPGLGRRDQK